MNPAQETVHAQCVRLRVVISAARRLAEDIEGATTADGFDLATSLQCVLEVAESLLSGLERMLTEGGAA